MINSIYSSAVAITIGILIISIFSFNRIYLDTNPGHTTNGNKYIKIKDQVISVPHHMLEAILIRYRTRLINHAKSRTDIDLLLLAEIEKSLADHVWLKYQIKFNMYPFELDKYILNQGVPKSNIYDDELVGGIDISTTAHSLGTIVWYLEKIILQNRNTKHSVEVPLVLEKMDALILNKSKARIQPTYNELQTVNPNLPAVIDILDNGEQWRLPTKSTPKKCSVVLRDNLQNFISDSAAQDWEGILAVGDDGNQKAKNLREASAGWQKNNIFRMSDVSHTHEHDFNDSNNRQLHSTITYAGYDLPLKLMKTDLKNRRNHNQKQSLTDDWEYIERQFLTN